MEHFWKCLLCAVMLCALLTACADSVPDPSQPVPSHTADTAPQTSENGNAYTVALDASMAVFGGPGYDNGYVGTVGEDGVYTILEEVTDAEGNVWGRLKSGIGWVDLSYARAFAVSRVPITACFADETRMDPGSYDTYLVEDSEYTSNILFRAREPLSDVKFVSLAFGDASYETDAVLYAVDMLTPETPFVLGVVFYGDLTAYGVTFTDSEGNTHRYAVTVSGRNGMLITQPY